MEAQVRDEEVEHQAVLQLVHELVDRRARVPLGLRHVSLEVAHDDPVVLLLQRDECALAEVEAPPVGEAEGEVEAAGFRALLQHCGKGVRVLRHSRQDGDVALEGNRVIDGRRSSDPGDADLGGIAELGMRDTERRGVERGGGLHFGRGTGRVALTFASALRRLDDVVESVEPVLAHARESRGTQGLSDALHGERVPGGRAWGKTRR